MRGERDRPAKGFGNPAAVSSDMVEMAYIEPNFDADCDG
jgi:hypothetical protein